MKACGDLHARIEIAGDNAPNTRDAQATRFNDVLARQASYFYRVTIYLVKINPIGSRDLLTLPFQGSVAKRAGQSPYTADFHSTGPDELGEEFRAGLVDHGLHRGDLANPGDRVAGAPDVGPTDLDPARSGRRLPGVAAQLEARPRPKQRPSQVSEQARRVEQA